MGEDSNDHLAALAGIGFAAKRGGDIRKAADNHNRILEAVRSPLRMSTTDGRYPFCVNPGEVETPMWNMFWPVAAYKNVAAANITHLMPCIPDRTNEPTGLDDDVYALRAPDQDAPLLTYVSVTEGTVAQNEYGIAIPMISGPYFVEVDQAVEVHDSVGALDGETTFMKDVVGYRVMSYHLINTDHFATVYRDISVILKSKDDPGDPGADQQTFNTADADGTAGGQDMIGDVPGS